MFVKSNGTPNTKSIEFVTTNFHSRSQSSMNLDQLDQYMGGGGSGGMNRLMYSANANVNFLNIDR